jgi:hypothetical protein
MTDETGAAGAATESIAQYQAQNNADDGVVQFEPDVDHTQETARNSLDRAFAALDVETSDSSEQGHNEYEQVKLKDTASTSQGHKPSVTSMEAPARFSADAKAAWRGVPDSVKGEVGRAFRELEGGMARYQEAFEPLRSYFHMASQSNTTVHDALERYTALDGALISEEPGTRLQAIESILDYAGITPRQYASFILGQKPDEMQTRNDETVRDLRQQITSLHHHLGGITKSIQDRYEDETLRQVEAFAEANPRLNEPDFQMTVLRLLQTQMATDLQSAYEMAERLTPAPNRIALIPRPTAAQTRNGNLSVTGAPGAGSNPARRKAPSTARESVDGAFASLGLG